MMIDDDGKRRAPAPGLYLVATPIGNLRDITLRALDVLEGADLIACEDSRVTGKLLAAHGISTPTTPYHEHNAAAARPGLIYRLREGAAVALVSDAGTPLVSDPGFKLVCAAREAGIPIHPVPGPSAVLAALGVSGLPTDQFHFAGFLPPRAAARRTALKNLAAIPGTLVLFESARRLADMLADAETVLGPRPATVCRELTKLYEEAVPGPLGTLSQRYKEFPARGEVVVVIGAKAPAAASDHDIDRALAAALGQGSLRDSVDAVAADTGAPRKRVYARALALRGERSGPVGPKEGERR